MNLFFIQQTLSQHRNCPQSVIASKQRTAMHVRALIATENH